MRDYRAYNFRQGRERCLKPIGPATMHVSSETLRCRYAELLHLREHVQRLESSWQDTAVRNTPPEPERPAKAETDHG